MGLLFHDHMSYSSSFLILVGGAALLHALWRFINILYRGFAYQTKWSKWGGDSKGNSRAWALVTGATDGIGKQFALQLAAKGYNILLVSRTLSKLENTAGEIHAQSPGVKTAVAQVDFSNVTPNDVESLKKSIAAAQPLRVVFNNVGQSYPFPEYYHHLDPELIDRLVTLNVKSVNLMTRLVVPSMLENYDANKERSLIVNIGSFAQYDSPLLAVYAGTKAYVDTFSRSIASEYGPLGIDVVPLHPAFVATKLAKIQERHANMFQPLPNKYVASVLRTVNDKSVTSYAGYLWHDIMIWAVRFVIPTPFFHSRALAMHKNLRKRAYKKIERQAKEN